MTAGDPHVLSGSGLDLDAARRIVFEGLPVAIAPEAEMAMARGREVVERYIENGIPAYGITTGLGARAGETLGREELAAFSLKMVRGRAQGVGPLLDRESVRAVLLARLNCLLTGAAGVSPHVAQFLADALNRDLLPAMPGIASIGAGDLVAMAAVPHAFIGEGAMLVDGAPAPARDALTKAGVKPLVLGPKDGLVLCNNTAFTTGLALTAVLLAERLVAGLQAAAALSLEGFRASPTPFMDPVAALRPQAGQVEAARQLNALLGGSRHWQSGTGRRLQDPLSFRCIAQVHGALIAQVDHLAAAVETELNGVCDNPAVVVETGEIVSTGNFHTPYLGQCLDGAARALAWAANDSVSRVHRLMSSAMSDLPPLLSSHDTARGGFGPLLKPMEALRAQIVHLANPVPVMSSFNADGIEDSATFAALAAQKLKQLLGGLELLVAYELLAGAQAADLAGGEAPGGRLGEIYAAVRDVCPKIDEDRPLAAEVAQIAEAVREGALSGVAQ